MLNREGRQFMEMAPRLAMWAGGGSSRAIEGARRALQKANRST